MTTEEIARHYPFANLEDIILGSHNRRDEGFDGAGIFDWQPRRQQTGVVYRHDQVVRLKLRGAGNGRPSGTGDQVVPGVVITWPTRQQVAAMVGFDLLVEPRRRFSFVFSAQTPMTQSLPLTIDPTVHFCARCLFSCWLCAR